MESVTPPVQGIKLTSRKGWREDLLLIFLVTIKTSDTLGFFFDNVTIKSTDGEMREFSACPLTARGIFVFATVHCISCYFSF